MVTQPLQSNQSASAASRERALFITNANMPLNKPGESSDEFKFTFEYYLDHSARIEADPNPSSNELHETASLTDSIFEYHREYGRTYHAYRAGSYHVPNDQMELERMDNQYEIIKILLDRRLYLAPLSHENPPRKILDVATGTGRWAIEMADEFPEAQIIGTDLSPIQPEIVPPNLSFYIDDGNEEWQQGEDWYDIDYIHFRVTVAAWSNWPWMIRTAFERLRPGGWLEMQEPKCDIDGDDGDISADNALKRWFTDLRKASALANRPIHVVPDLKRMLIEAGFVDVHEKVYKIPLNSWPRSPKLKMIGELWQRSLGDGLSGFSYAFFDRYLGMCKEEIDVSLVDVRRALADRQTHAYEKFYVVWGRKPGDAADIGGNTGSQSVPLDEDMTGNI